MEGIKAAPVPITDDQAYVMAQFLLTIEIAAGADAPPRPTKDEIARYRINSPMTLTTQEIVQAHGVAFFLKRQSEKAYREYQTKGGVMMIGTEQHGGALMADPTPCTEEEIAEARRMLAEMQAWLPNEKIVVDEETLRLHAREMLAIALSCSTTTRQ